MGKADSVTDEFHARRRDLPHFQQGGSTYFITFRLFKLETVALLSGEEREIVKQAILALHERMWRVHMLTVMANHAHILATPLRQASGNWYGLPVILQRVKGGRAYHINTHRQTTGQLWQRESFDRIIRNEAEYLEKATYILSNAVKAAIVEDGWTYDGFWYDVGDVAG